MLLANSEARLTLIFAEFRAIRGQRRVPLQTSARIAGLCRQLAVHLAPLQLPKPDRYDASSLQPTLPHTIGIN